MPKHNNRSNNHRLAFTTGDKVLQHYTKKALASKRVLEHARFSHNSFPNQRADTAFLDAHGRRENRHNSHTAAFKGQTAPTLPILQEIQATTHTKNLVLISCYGGAAMGDVRKYVVSFEDSTAFLVLSGTKNSCDAIYTPEDIAGISAHLVQPGKTLATAFARQIPFTAETMVYAEIINGKLYEVKFASPKDAKTGKREDEISSLKSVDEWKNFMRNNLKFRSENGEWEKLPGADIPDIFQERAAQIRNALEVIIAPLQESHLQAYKHKALIIAIIRNNPERARALITAGANVNATGKVGRTPLHIACRAGHTEVVEQLITAGVNSRIKDKNGWTPLHFACERGHADVVRTLMNHGANPYKHSFSLFWSPSQLANIYRHKDITTMLKQYKESGRNPYLACRIGNIHAVKAFLAKGADVDAPNNVGLTMREIAQVNGHTQIAKLLEEAKTSQEEKATKVRQTHTARVAQTRSRIKLSRSLFSCPLWTSHVRQNTNAQAQKR